MQLESRPYDHRDVTALVAAVQDEYEQIYGEPDATVVDPSDFADPNGWFAVGYEHGRPVAMGGWRRRPAGGLVPGTAPAEIKRMYVVPEARGRGLSRLVLAAIEESAGAAGIDVLVLESGEPQTAAVALYRNSGYTDAPRFGHYADEQDAVYLAKRLGSPQRVGLEDLLDLEPG